MGDLDPVEPVRRYERATPGELIHIDIKKLGRIDGIGHRITGDRRGQSNRRGRGRGLGWQFAHVCVDDASRIAFAEMKRDETAASAVEFLGAAVAYYRNLGVAVARVMTDNGSCYKAIVFRDACRDLGLKHIRTTPYTPRTTDVIDKCFLAGSELFFSRARVTAWRRAGREAQALPRSLHCRPSVAVPVRARFGPRLFQPATKRA
jgi:transposase InsO family protein